MAGESTSPNMNLILPGVGTTLGPLWATDLNNSLSIIDSHNHSAGSGVQITPDGLNINAELPVLNNAITGIKRLGLQLQSSISDVSSIYLSGVDLYFNDANGNVIQITQDGGVAGTPGSIANLVSPASASYVGAGSKFVWQSNVNTPAIMDSGYLILRNINTSGYGLTLTPPTLSSNYSITLPTLPASQKIMTLDNSGNMSAPYVVDNSTIEISSNTIQVKASGIGTSQIADDAVTTIKILNSNVTTTKIADAAVTPAKLSASNYVVSSSCGSFSTGASDIAVTNLSVTITTNGRPVQLSLQPDGTATNSFVGPINSASQATLDQIIFIKRDSTLIYQTELTNGNGSAIVTTAYLVPPGVVNFMDLPAAGTYTYSVRTTAVSGDSKFNNCVLVAREL